MSAVAFSPKSIHLNHEEQHQLRAYYREVERALGTPLTDVHKKKLIDFFEEIGRRCLMSATHRSLHERIVINITRTIKTPFCPPHVMIPQEIISSITPFVPFSTLASIMPCIDRGLRAQKHHLLEEHLWHRTHMNSSELVSFSRALSIGS